MNSELFSDLDFLQILDLLSECTLSPPAKEIVRNIIPQIHLDKVREKLRETTELKRIIESGENFPISPFRDISPLLKRAAVDGAMLSPEELLDILNVLKISRSIKNFFHTDDERYPLTAEKVKHISSFEWLEKEVGKCIDISGDIKDCASRKLMSIRKSLKVEEGNIRKEMEKLMGALSRKNALQAENPTVRDGRLVIPIKREFKKHIRGIVHGLSSTGATLYIEPMEVVEINNRISELSSQERAEIERILKRLTHFIFENLNEIRANFEILVEVDFRHARALLSRRLRCVEPTLNSGSYINIVNARNPVLELKRKVVPLNLTIGDDYSTLVITGPNAGGKTVALKTVGLLILMVQCGLHVPADEGTELSIFNDIFADIGDRQSIEKDLSTFSSRINNIIDILKHSSRGSLILLDEIGTATDPAEGSALATAVLEELTRRGSTTIATTHHGSLKVFAFNTPGVKNGSMEFDHRTLQPTYKFRLDVPGSSYAFEISERLGMPGEIIKRSRESLGKERDDLEKLISELERTIRSLHEERMECRERITELQNLIDENMRMKNELERQRKLLKKEALIESKMILEESSSLIEKVIKEIKEEKASKDSIIRAKKEVAEKREAVESSLDEIKDTEDEWKASRIRAEDLKKGIPVLIGKMNAVGKVLSMVDSGGRVMVELDNVKLKVHMDDLYIPPESSAQKSEFASTSKIMAGKRVVSTSRPYSVPGKGVSRRSYVAARTVPIQIDLKGLRGDEAIDRVDKYLDDVLLAGLQKVKIIHGVGTGVLKKLITGFLETHPAVKSFRRGSFEEGGEGVTIVELK